MKKKTKSKSKETEMFLELAGNVYIVEKLGDKEIQRDVIEGDVVLQCLLNTLTQALQTYGALDTDAEVSVKPKRSKTK